MADTAGNPELTQNAADIDNKTALTEEDNATVTGTLTFSTGPGLEDSVTLKFGTGDDATIQYDGTNLLVDPQAVGSGVVNFSAGFVCINETANANMTQGITINQGANDDEILALKSSDVAHGVTDETETDTYGLIRKVVSTTGGMEVQGYSEGITQAALQLTGVSTGDDTTKGVGGKAPVSINAAKKSGTGIASPGADANIFVVRLNASTRFIIDEDGDTHRDGTSNTFADYDDPMMLLAFEHSLSPKAAVVEQFNRYCDYNRDSLIQAGVMHESGFYNESALLRLTVGGVWQTAVRQRQLEDENERLAGELAAVQSRLSAIEGSV